MLPVLPRATELTGGGGRIEAGQSGPEGHGLRPVWFALPLQFVLFVCTLLMGLPQVLPSFSLNSPERSYLISNVVHIPDVPKRPSLASPHFRCVATSAQHAPSTVGAFNATGSRFDSLPPSLPHSSPLCPSLNGTTGTGTARRPETELEGERCSFTLHNLSAQPLPVPLFLLPRPLHAAPASQFSLPQCAYHQLSGGHRAVAPGLPL